MDAHDWVTIKPLPLHFENISPNHPVENISTGNFVESVSTDHFVKNISTDVFVENISTDNLVESISTDSTSTAWRTAAPRMTKHMCRPPTRTTLAASSRRVPSAR